MLYRPGMFVLAVLGCTFGVLRAESAESTTVIRTKSAPFAERLAAKEVRRYIYLRTGNLLPILDDLPGKVNVGLIVVGAKDRPAVQSLLSDAKLKVTIDGLTSEQYAIKTLKYNGQPVLLIAGGDAIGTLYGAYRFAEHLGIRFYMHGDVVPDNQIVLALPALDEVRRPLFDHRGIQPFHDFPEGPDWWCHDGYKAILGQLPKMGMNFFGLHTYPENNVGPEPLVWIGMPDELAPGGKVKASYPSRHFTTTNITAAWGYSPGNTGDYVFGAADLFDRDDYGADYMCETYPWNQMSPEQCNALFDRMGKFLGDVFAFAHRLGVKTCIGTETPLVIPTSVKRRLRAAGKNPADPVVVQKLYEGIFQRVAKIDSLDYYWLWTPEGWTWGTVSQQQIDETVADLQASLVAAKAVNAPFTLATCGWVLGPPQSPSLFDAFLPKNMPMSCINRMVGRTPVERGFAKVAGRPKWAIPWMEDDAGLTIPQLWVGRMRRDAADALEYGCTGLMGIHWRTHILAPNVSALAKATWDQSGWGDEPKGVVGQKPRQPEGAEGGEVASFPNSQISGADDSPLYQTVRYNVATYHLDVPNGVYNVTLKLCEPRYAEKGVRVFGANMQGKMLFEHLDIFAKVGLNRALDFTAKDVQVSDGRLTIEFVGEVEFPCIAGIAVEGNTAVSNQFPSAPYKRRINCGGPAHKDYEADLPTIAPGGKPRYLPVKDFYADWARAEFGPEAAEPIGEVFTRIDGHLPRPVDWVTGPGSVRPDGRPWEQIQRDYAFVDELESLRPRIQGPGNLERFDYWLNSFHYLRSIARFNCTWARFNDALNKAKAEKRPDRQKKLARELVLPVRKELIAVFAELHRHLLATVTSPGEMGNVCNWQQQTLPVALTKPGQELTKLLGEHLPTDAMPSKRYVGKPRLFMPEVRTNVVAGESLKLRAIILGGQPQDAVVCWRPLGSGAFTKVPLAHLARGVYTVALPDEAVKTDFEYYVQATVDGTSLVFPPTAPAMNQTVVIEER